MSRLKSLKEKIRKKTIKTTMASLALALAIGSTQIMGTYALFTDTEDIASNLDISTGDVDVEAEVVESLSQITGLQPGDTITGKFKIINNGTLNQNLILNINADNANLPEGYDILNYLDWSISFESYNGKSIKTISKSSQNKEIRYNTENDDLVTLNPSVGSYITANVNLNLSGNIPAEVQSAIAGKDIGINLQISSYQTNATDNIKTDGFWDRDIKYNNIQLGEINLISGDAIKVSGHGEGLSGNDITIEFKAFTNIVTSNKVKVQVLEDEHNKPTGAFVGSNAVAQTKDKFVITTNIKTNTIPREFKGEHTITIRFTEGSKSVIVKFDFRTIDESDIHGNLKLQAKYEIIKFLKEEIEESSESEVVDTSKEEEAVPSEAEILEKPKEEEAVPSEPEVVEQLKEESVVLSKPDIIEQSKEEIEIQE